MNLLCRTRGDNRHFVRRRLLEGVERVGLATQPCDRQPSFHRNQPVEAT